MLEAPPKEGYTRVQVRRVLGVSERQLRSWEGQDLVPRLDTFTFSDLIALRTLQQLRKNRVSSSRIRAAVAAIRSKLGDVRNPLKELKVFSEGRKVAVVVDGAKMEPVSGQLLLDFDAGELTRLVSFPGMRASQTGAREGEAEVWFQKGLELEQTGAPVEDIIDAYQRAIELDTRSAGALVNLGTVHFHLRAWDKAEAYYRRALEADPSYALAHFNLGNLFDEKGDADTAAHEYGQAILLNPNYADAHYNLALLHQNRGELMKALRHWRTYLKLDPTSSWAAIARRELNKLRKAAVIPGSAAPSEVDRCS